MVAENFPFRVKYSANRPGKLRVQAQGFQHVSKLRKLEPHVKFRPRVASRVIQFALIAATRRVFVKSDGQGPGVVSFTLPQNLDTFRDMRSKACDFKPYQVFVHCLLL